MRIIITDNSNRDLIEMFAKSFEKLKGHNKFVNPDVVTKDALAKGQTA